MTEHVSLKDRAQDKIVPHETSLAVWAIPATVAAGERFSVMIGAKSSADCALAGGRVAVLDAAGTVAASAVLGDAPWPGTSALFWAEVELLAPDTPDLAGFSARLDAMEFDTPHTGAAVGFSVAIVAPPEHALTVKVAAGTTPVEEAHIRLGPHRAITDASGLAQVRLATGCYQLQIWKAGYDIPDMPVTIDADVSVVVEARALPEENPDAHWTA